MNSLLFDVNTTYFATARVQHYTEYLYSGNHKPEGECFILVHATCTKELTTLQVVTKITHQFLWNSNSHLSLTGCAYIETQALVRVYVVCWDTSCSKPCYFFNPTIREIDISQMVRYLSCNTIPFMQYYSKTNSLQNDPKKSIFTTF